MLKQAPKKLRAEFKILNQQAVLTMSIIHNCPPSQKKLIERQFELLFIKPVTLVYR